MRSLLVIAVALSLVGSAQAWSPPIQLAAQAPGGQQVVLHWSNAQTSTVTIYRDGAFLENTPNVNQPYPGLTLAGQPLGTHVYKVCEPAITTQTRCSNPATVTIT